MVKESQAKTPIQINKSENELKDLSRAAEKFDNLPHQPPDSQKPADQNQELLAEEIPNIEGWARDFFKK